MLSPGSVCRVSKINAAIRLGANSLLEFSGWQQPQIVQP
ncbi:hypothetical protein HMPREF1570_3380 [Klebsiella oxytoca KA-2]|nr:hypothetical protein HMPREF1570_3380 [Klebsiella oxytoca KA-2]